jgi:acetolactate synthase-1/2/3 large subunit
VGFSPSGGLGFGVGGALGAKLAAPDRTVISVVGDGTYLLGVPASAHLVSAAEELPVLWIVVDNHGWGAVREQARQVHPEGWGERSGTYPFVRFGAEPRYELLSRACGGAGEAVTTPRALPGALERALQMVRGEGRQALLRVECGEPTFRL